MEIAADPADTLVTGTEAARICGVTPAAIRMLVSRGQLTQAETRPSPGGGLTAYYRLGDLFAVRAWRHTRRPIPA